MILCEICENYRICIDLCDDAEDYVNQDYMRSNEIPISQLGLDINTVVELPWGDVKEIKLNQTDWTMLKDILGNELTTKQQDYLFMHYWLGIPQAELGRIHNVSQQAISNVIYRAKKKIHRRLSKRPLTGL